jgi:hypothetical protein
LTKSSRSRPPRGQGLDSTESPGSFEVQRQGVWAGECREPGGDREVRRVRPGRQDEGPRRGGRRMRWGLRREAARLHTTSKGRARRGQGPPAAGPPCPDRRQDRDCRLLTLPPLKGVGFSVQRSMLTRGRSDMISLSVSRLRLTSGDGSVRVVSRRFGQVAATRPAAARLIPWASPRASSGVGPRPPRRPGHRGTRRDTTAPILAGAETPAGALGACVAAWHSRLITSLTHRDPTRIEDRRIYHLLHRACRGASATGPAARPSRRASAPAGGLRAMAHRPGDRRRARLHPIERQEQRPDTRLETRRKSRCRKLLIGLHLRKICRRNPFPGNSLQHLQKTSAF